MSHFQYLNMDLDYKNLEINNYYNASIIIYVYKRMDGGERPMRSEFPKNIVNNAYKINEQLKELCDRGVLELEERDNADYFHLTDKGKKIAEKIIEIEELFKEES